ncbi:MAG TPA: hypothetical protein DCY93_01100 [Firmicutes bacterium]|nr:hypothetical protein [Bacillota bacterium]
MTDLQTAKNNLEGHTICLCKNGKCLYSNKKGISPMMDFIESDVDLKGYSAADLIVGKAAAILFIKSGIIKVFAKTLSLNGKNTLEKYGIIYEYETLTEKIINRDGTDICPMEKAVMEIDDIEKSYQVLKSKLKELSR